VINVKGVTHAFAQFSGDFISLPPLLEMVVHQAVGVDLKTGLLARFGEGLEKILAVHIIPEDRPFAICPAQDMVNWGVGEF
jgi:hypothetical protein